jgi:hypothetical protein
MKRKRRAGSPPALGIFRNSEYGEIKYALAFPRIIRLEKTLQNSLRARFTTGLALQTGCLVVPDLTPLLTKIRTLIHEEISLPWRTLFPRSSNDPMLGAAVAGSSIGGLWPPAALAPARKGRAGAARRESRPGWHGLAIRKTFSTK